MTEETQSADKLPASVWTGSFRIFGVDVRCHVLDTGERIIEADSMHALLEAMANPVVVDLGDAEAFAAWRQCQGIPQ